MKIDIQAAGYRLTGWLLEHVVQRVRDFLAHRRDRIRNVTVRLIEPRWPEWAARTSAAWFK
ncbi:MAG: hypothetical protein MZW92_80360 [Comamonadaceae bacterium]|nr:hypothetical protein [Comamonadaceae bacterium]